MINYQYKDCTIEIFTAKISGKWSSALIIDGKGAGVIRGFMFNSQEAVEHAAKAEAQRLINTSIKSVYLETFSEIDAGPVGISA